jgi:S-adenosyl-L-methionine hydrolase (adenosine-forming)
VRAADLDGYRSITFLTDFGLQDDFVGVCHGVIRRIVPDVSIVDITHGIRPQAILQGAVVLANTVPYMPVAVHLAVVDPEVGSKRRGVAVQARDGRVYVGPDNGLLMLAADAGGVETAVELVDERYRLERVSRTFHARDVFSPAAAHLAAGVGLQELGPPVDASTLVRLAIPEPEIRGSQARTSVLAIDRFGNIQLNLRREQLDSFDLDPGDRIEIAMQLEAYYAVVANTFADAATGELILYEDSYGLYSIAISGGDAAALTAASPGDEIRLLRP